MKRILITGANGFIGSSLTTFLNNKGYKIFCLTSKPINSNSNGVTYIKCPMNNYHNLSKLLDTQLEYDAFIHLAWQGTSGIDRDNFQVQELNYIYSKSLFDQIKQHFKIKKIVSFGSIIQDDFLINSLANRVLFNPYGLFKTLVENTFFNTFSNSNIKANWIKLIHVFGPNDNQNRFISKTLSDIYNNKELHFTKSDQYYDFIHIKDAIELIYKIILDENHKLKVTLTSNNQFDLKTYINKILNVLNYSGKVHYDIESNSTYIPLSSFVENNPIIKNYYFSLRFEERVKELYETIYSKQ